MQKKTIMLKKNFFCITTLSFCVNYIILASQNIYFFNSQNIYFICKKNDYVEKKFFLHYDIIVLC